MQRDGGNIDFRNVINADRGGRTDNRHAGRIIGEAAAIQDMVRGEGLDLAGRAINPDP